MNLTSGRLRSAHDRHANAQGVWSIAFTPNGRAAVSTSADHTAIVWDVRSGDEREVLTGHTDIVVSQAISEDGQTLYTGSADGTVIAWDLGGRRRLGQELPFSPEYPANIFSLGSATGPQPTSVAVSPNGRLLALSPGHGLVRIWNLETLRPEGPPLRGFTEGDLTYPNGGAQDLAFSPSSRLLAAGGGFGSPIIIWNVATGGIVRTLRPPNPVACRRMALSVRLVNPTCPAGAGLAFSPNGRTLADGDAINGALLWDLKAGTFTRLPVRRGDSVLSLAYSPDGTHLVTIDHQDRGVLWDVAHRHRIASFPAQRANLWGPINVAFSRDGNRFATASGNTIVLRSGSTGKPVAKPISLANAYGGALALSADGSTLAVIAGDGVELWDTSTRTEIGAALPGAPLQNANPGGPGNLLFTPDGHRVIIVNPDGHATIWNFAPSAWKAKACQIAGRNLTEAEWRQFLPDRTYQPVC
jgi:WD40 repeat protein